MLDARLSRRAVLAGLGCALGGLAAAGCRSESTPVASTVPGAAKLPFDPQAFTEKTVAVATASGDKQVAYRFFGPVTYVANPVDADYQSLIISVPRIIDGRAVDASEAPIVFANSVGGYMPASVKDADGVGRTGGPTLLPGQPPPDAATGEVPSGGNAMLDSGGGRVDLAQLALAAGFVVVEPGCRGRTLIDSAGVYYGTAPAAIVDLKAAVRYLRSNADTVPGDTDHIVSTGTSAGGALSALLGASGDSPLYDRYLGELGAADASDAIFASADWCPITDLEHADAAYEWNWGTCPTQDGGGVDQAVGDALRRQFADYMNAAKINGRNDFGPLTADNYDRYLLDSYIQPAATTYLQALTEGDRAEYLAANDFIRWEGGQATFTWADYLDHVGARKKAAPAFDAFDLSTGENNLFGGGTTKARHFTPYGAADDTAGPTALAADIPDLLALMNPMHHLAHGGTKVAPHWWIRLGTKDTDTSLTVSANLAAAVGRAGGTVDHAMYWDEGHGANIDAVDFIAWIDHITN